MVGRWVRASTSQSVQSLWGLGSYLARDYEGDGLDRVRGQLVSACDLAFRSVDRTPRDEAHPALRIARFVFV